MDLYLGGLIYGTTFALVGLYTGSLIFGKEGRGGRDGKEGGGGEGAYIQSFTVLRFQFRINNLYGNEQNF